MKTSTVASTALAAFAATTASAAHEPSAGNPLVARSSSSVSEFDGLLMAVADITADQSHAILTTPNAIAENSDLFIFTGKYPDQMLEFIGGPNGTIVHGLVVKSDAAPLETVPGDGSPGFYADKITGNQTQQLQFKGSDLSGFYACSIFQAEGPETIGVFYTANGTVTRPGPCAPITLLASNA